jgi:hypothetical protein
MCQHLHACPDAQAPDRMAARVAADHLEQRWSLLCNGVVLFEDGGALPADGHAVAPPRIGMALAAGGVRRAGMTRMMSGWLMRGRRGTTGHLCAGCSGQSGPASPPCSNWLSGTCRAENRQPSWRATGGSAIIACLSEGLGWTDLNIVHGL